MTVATIQPAHPGRSGHKLIDIAVYMITALMGLTMVVIVQGTFATPGYLYYAVPAFILGLIILVAELVSLRQFHEQMKGRPNIFARKRFWGLLALQIIAACLLFVPSMMEMQRVSNLIDAVSPLQISETGLKRADHQPLENVVIFNIQDPTAVKLAGGAVSLLCHLPPLHVHQDQIRFGDSVSGTTKNGVNLGIQAASICTRLQRAGAF